MREPPRPMPIALGLSQGVALRSAGPVTSCWTSSPWFRLDRLAELAGRLNQLGEGDAGCGEVGLCREPFWYGAQGVSVKSQHADHRTGRKVQGFVPGGVGRVRRGGRAGRRMYRRIRFHPAAVRLCRRLCRDVRSSAPGQNRSAGGFRPRDDAVGRRWRPMVGAGFRPSRTERPPDTFRRPHWIRRQALSTPPRHRDQSTKIGRASCRERV